jgi:hypothetical protein
MPTIADYVVVRDAAFTLHTDGKASGARRNSRNYSFALPKGFRSDRAALLAFLVDPNPSPSVKLQVFLGTAGASKALVNEYVFSTGALRGLWEVFAPGPRKIAAGTNVIEFIVWSSPPPVGRNTGSLVVRDIIIWFKRDIP